jgi:hypothetical protein
MPTTDKNRDGGHSHPQKSGKNQSQGNPDKPDTGKGANKPDQTPKESFGSGGAKDSH